MAQLALPLAIGGTLLSGIGTIAAGNAANSAAEFNAEQIEVQGQQERAAASRRAAEERRQTRLAQSRARAIAAASGGGPALDVLGGLEEEGELRALTALFEGEERARGRTNQARAARYGGRAKRRAAMIEGIGTIAAGGGSLLDKYG